MKNYKNSEISNEIFDFYVVIPARLNSTRLPKKMTKKIFGIPLVIWVAMQAAKSKAKKVLIATDSIQIAKIANKYKFDAVLTKKNHNSGTERLTEVIKIKKWKNTDLVINVQGDEPLIDPNVIDSLASAHHKKEKFMISTLITPIKNKSDYINPNVVKVIINKENIANYFSRAPIPHLRDSTHKFQWQKNHSFRHIGIYAYQVRFLKEFHKLKRCNIENCENLEQLRFLYHGYEVFCKIINEVNFFGVDTAEDLEKVKTHMKKIR